MRRHYVSRITARRALAELAGLGLVERRRRSGTSITYRAPRRVERTMMDADGRPLLFTVASYCADRDRISIDFHAPEGPKAPVSRQSPAP